MNATKFYDAGQVSTGYKITISTEEHFFMLNALKEVYKDASSPRNYPRFSRSQVKALWGMITALQEARINT